MYMVVCIYTSNDTHGNCIQEHDINYKNTSCHLRLRITCSPEFKVHECSYNTRASPGGAFCSASLINKNSDSRVSDWPATCQRMLYISLSCVVPTLHNCCLETLIEERSSSAPNKEKEEGGGGSDITHRLRKKPNVTRCLCRQHIKRYSYPSSTTVCHYPATQTVNIFSHTKYLAILGPKYMHVHIPLQLKESCWTEGPLRLLEATLDSVMPPNQRVTAHACFTGSMASQVQKLKLLHR